MDGFNTATENPLWSLCSVYITELQRHVCSPVCALLHCLLCRHSLGIPEECEIPYTPCWWLLWGCSYSVSSTSSVWFSHRNRKGLRFVPIWNENTSWNFPWDGNFTYWPALPFMPRLCVTDHPAMVVIWKWGRFQRSSVKLLTVPLLVDNI